MGKKKKEKVVDLKPEKISEEELKADFKGFEILLLEETEIYLSEGKYHNGKGSVIRFVGRKK